MVSPARARTQTAHSRIECTNHEAIAPPIISDHSLLLNEFTPLILHLHISHTCPPLQGYSPLANIKEALSGVFGIQGVLYPSPREAIYNLESTLQITTLLLASVDVVFTIFDVPP